MEADIISGIEASADPDNDDDYSDRADVLNLSLGGAGHPDDAMSTAVDNAAELGIICCVAAGNTGQNGFNSIESPGTARLAITVGASTNYDGFSYFSSKGPNKRICSVKPEILAPGYGIKSTYPGGGYINMNGTSMAAPHAAGLCALIRQSHRNWSPLEVKSAIMTTAKLRDALEVMMQGAGRIDAWKAVNVKSLITPAQLSFGLDNTGMQTWAAADTITIQNISGINQNYVISVTGLEAGIMLEASPSSLALNPGESQQVVFSLSVDNNIVEYKSSGSLAYSGYINISSSLEELHLPWAFVKACMVNFTFDKSNVHFVMADDKNYFAGSSLYDDWYQSDFLLPDGNYDMIFNFQGTTPPKFVIKENIPVEGTINVEVSSGDAKNTVEVKGVDESGVLLSANGRYKTNFAFLFPDSSSLNNYIYWNNDMNSILCSDFSDRFSLLSAEYQDNVPQKRVFINQNELTRSLSSNIVITNNPGDYRRTKIKLHLTPGAPSPWVSFGNFLKLKNAPSFTVVGNGSERKLPSNRWDVNLFLTGDKDPDIGFSTIIHGKDSYYIEDIQKSYLFITEPFSVHDNKIVNLEFTANANPALYYSGEDGEFNYGTVSVPHTWLVFSNMHEMIAVWECRTLGHHLENLPGQASLLKIYNADGSDLSQGFGAIIVTPGVYTSEITDTSYRVQNIRGTAKLTCKFDLTKPICNPPAVTSLQVRNSEGIPVNSIRPGETAEVRFSGGKSEGYFSHKACAEAKLFFKEYGTTDWQELHVNRLVDDPVTGSLFSASIPVLTAEDPYAVDLKIILKDEYDNTTEWKLEPAFAAGEPEEVTPVELTGLTAVNDCGFVALRWQTHSEKNNYGFKIERSTEGENWQEIGLVEGAGTSAEGREYLYTDDISELRVTKIRYRLKQIDFDGKFVYSQQVEVTCSIPAEYKLMQNYPNPFNSSTLIKYDLPYECSVRIVLINILGEVVKEIINNDEPAGFHQLRIDMNDFSSGTYFYSIDAVPLQDGRPFKSVKKMMLLR